jgi:hypothetical protein
VVTVTDGGGEVTVLMEGWTWNGRKLTAHSFTDTV